MKSRPRKIENRVAEELNKALSDVGWQEIRRIPVLGRAGPDMTINESLLAIDVKSRMSVPKLILGGTKRFDDFIAVPLKDLLNPGEPIEVRPSKQILDWYYHMEDWVIEQLDAHGKIYYAGLVLHKSMKSLPVGKSAFVMRESEYHSLIERVEHARRETMDDTGNPGHPQGHRRGLRSL